MQTKRTKAKTLPVKSKNFEDYTEDTTTKIPDLPSSARLFTKPAKNKFYVFKPNDRPNVSDIEAFNGFCHSLLNNNHPVVRTVYDKNGKRKGVMSELIPNFRTIETFKPLSLEENVLLETEIIKVLAESYIEDENNLDSSHFGFGYNKQEQLKAFKINDAQSASSSYIVKIYFRKDVSSVNGVKNASAMTFRFTARDISNLMNLKDRKPMNWPTDRALVELEKNDQARQGKLYVFLKRILIPDSVYENIGLATIKSTAIKSILVKNKIAKTKELKNVLLEMPEFHQYISENPDVINKICGDFDIYNQNYLRKNKNHFLQVNTIQIRENFEKIPDRVRFYYPAEKAWHETFFQGKTQAQKNKINQAKKIFWISVKPGYLKAFLGVPVFADRTVGKVFGYIGMPLTFAHNSLKFFLEFLPKWLSAYAEYGIHQLSKKKKVSTSGLYGITLVGLIFTYFLAEGFRLTMRALISPITSARAGYEHCLNRKSKNEPEIGVNDRYKRLHDKKQDENGNYNSRSPLSAGSGHTGNFAEHLSPGFLARQVKQNDENKLEQSEYLLREESSPKSDSAVGSPADHSVASRNATSPALKPTSLSPQSVGRH